MRKLGYLLRLTVVAVLALGSSALASQSGPAGNDAITAPQSQCGCGGGEKVAPAPEEKGCACGEKTDPCKGCEKKGTDACKSCGKKEGGKPREGCGCGGKTAAASTSTTSSKDSPTTGTKKAVTTGAKKAVATGAKKAVATGAKKAAGASTTASKDTPTTGTSKAAVTGAKKAATTTKNKPQTLCPVMGGAINKKLYVDSDGKRIYVCCAMCISTINKDPAKYIKQLEDQGITLEKTPATAPATPAPSLPASGAGKG
jgi:hypothetical protein